MTPATLELFSAIINADVATLQEALAAGADVNATDKHGRSVVSYAALGTAIDAIHAAIQPRLSERRLDILQLITQHPELSLYSLNAPMAWAEGVTLLSLMSWLNMPSEIMCLLDFTHGLLEVNAMDDHGATPLMYAARDGNLQVVQRLLAHGARPDLKDVSQRSAIEYALPHPQLQWLCEEALRRSRQSELITSSTSITRMLNVVCMNPCRPRTNRPTEGLFFSPQRLLSPPSMAWLDGVEVRRTFDTLLSAIREHDVNTFRTVLFSSRSNINLDASVHQPGTSPSFGTPLLVNVRDDAGLTLAHHAVSQRPYPNIAILDALHRAGCDVGLYSTLGFSPLHHLSRTARDDAKGANDKQGPSSSSLNLRMHPLYTFTMHLVRDLRAPLRATDSKGETPVHAAAEHGHSLPVLLAMLDCDREFSGKEAVKQARNERGLRPVDVAKPEFLTLFLSRHQSHPTLLSDLQRRVFSPPNNQQHMLAGMAYSSSHFRLGRLVRQESDTSLMSRSSGSSSTSSGARSYGSHWSGYRPQRPNRSYEPSAPVQTLGTPEATPPSSFTHSSASSPDSYSSINAPAGAVDILDHLSFCSSALHAYTQLYTNMYGTDTYGIDSTALPDLSALADTLIFTRDLASRVLEHWTVRLEAAREEFERARRELGKTKALREHVGWDIKSVSRYPSNYIISTHHVEPRLRKAKSGGLRIHAGVQTDVDIHDASQDSHLPGLSLMDTESSESGDTETPTQTLSRYDPQQSLPDSGRISMDEERVGRPCTENTEAMEAGDRVLTRSVQLDLVEENCAVGRDVVAPTATSIGNAPLLQSNALDSIFPFPPGIPMVQVILQRADQDLQNVSAQFALVQQAYTYAHQSIAETRALVQQSIQVREEQLHILIRIHRRQDVLAQSSRLSPILERSCEPPLETTSTIDPRYIAALGPIEEPHVLRRMLTRKLAKYVENVFHNLRKAHTWLRIIREVLRGLRRRTLIQYCDDSVL